VLVQQTKAQCGEFWGLLSPVAGPCSWEICTLRPPTPTVSSLRAWGVPGRGSARKRCIPSPTTSRFLCAFSIKSSSSVYCRLCSLKQLIKRLVTALYGDNRLKSTVYRSSCSALPAAMLVVHRMTNQSDPAV
jgi:hypothetical protein